MKMTTAQVVEMSVTVNNSPIQYYVLLDNHAQLPLYLQHKLEHVQERALSIIIIIIIILLLLLLLLLLLIDELKK